MQWCALIRLQLYIDPTVLVDAGSRYEVDYTSGISHFIHRLAFQVKKKLTLNKFKSDFNL